MIVQCLSFILFCCYHTTDICNQLYILISILIIVLTVLILMAVLESILTLLLISESILALLLIWLLINN